MAEEMIPLNITIADRNYRIKVMPKDEEAVRKTLKVINDKILEFRGNFAGKDMQDYVSMVLIWYATQPQAAKNEFKQDELSEILERMEKHLEKFD
ncbi:MAG: cell division protein ZapA [Chitinophagaceae bacterium]|nr:cell division protein ZapA [Chitinophagaceae bacterium]